MRKILHSIAPWILFIIMFISQSNIACASEKFSQFKEQDLFGSEITEDFFYQNKLTVVHLWDTL